MDYGLWDPPYYRATEESKYENYGCSSALCFSYGHDVIEDTALDEKCCIQVLRILINKADTDIVELEGDLVHLQKQLFWNDEEFSNIFSLSLKLKIDSLDLSIRKLKDKHLDDDVGVFSPTSMESAECIDDILEFLFRQYFKKENEQFADNITNGIHSNHPVHTDNRLGKKEKMGSSSNANQMKKVKRSTITSLEKHTISKKRMIKSSIADRKKQDMGIISTSVEKHVTSNTRIKTEAENEDYPESTKAKMPTMAEGILLNSTPIGNSVCQHPSLKTQEKWMHQLQMIESQTDDTSKGSISDILEEAHKELNPKPEINIINSFSLEKNTITGTTRGGEIPNLVDTEQSAADTLLELSGERKNIKPKSDPKKRPINVRKSNVSPKVKRNLNLGNDYEKGSSSSNAVYGQENPKIDERRLRFDSVLEANSSSQCPLEGDKELRILEIDVANSQDIVDNKPYENDFFGSDFPVDNAESGIVDGLVCGNYTVDQLKAIAKKRKIKGYHKLRKLELAQLLGIKLIEGGKKHIRKEMMPLLLTQGEP